MFCPKCGSILMPKKEKNKKIMACSCGYKNDDTQSANLKEEGKAKEDVEVVDESKSDDVYPMVEQECPKCGNDKARYWEVQTRAADEPATKFFKCTECKHTWRDYS